MKLCAFTDGALRAPRANGVCAERCSASVCGAAPCRGVSPPDSEQGTALTRTPGLVIVPSTIRGTSAPPLAERELPERALDARQRGGSPARLCLARRR